MSVAEAPQRRVPPIKLLGARRAFTSLALGALLGPGVGSVVALIFLPVARSAGRRAGLVMMTLLFGLLFGPLLTLAAASALATHGFSGADFAAVGWRRIGLSALAGCALGIVAGFVLGAAFGPSDAITFMAAQIGGILGALAPASVLVGKVAQRRMSS